ncbi:hypothetical protein DFJ77DRAFT_438044 [Powellomyces hirtus]|nr:hypothetical protein DFJ77DRAFT_438044 [Powellomyces hirtus]
MPLSLHTSAVILPALFAGCGFCPTKRMTGVNLSDSLRVESSVQGGRGGADPLTLLSLGREMRTLEEAGGHLGQINYDQLVKRFFKGNEVGDLWGHWRSDEIWTNLGLTCRREGHLEL